MKTALIAVGLIALLGIVGTPDYVLDVERENDRLRAEVKRTTLELNHVRVATMSCHDADLVAAHYMLARGE